MEEAQKPPTQRINPAPVMDADDYLDGQFNDCRRKHGRAAAIFLETLVGTHVMATCVLMAMQNQNAPREVTDILNKFGHTNAQRMAYLAAISQDTANEIMEQATEIVDVLQAMDHSSLTNVH